MHVTLSYLDVTSDKKNPYSNPQVLINMIFGTELKKFDYTENGVIGHVVRVFKWYNV